MLYIITVQQWSLLLNPKTTVNSMKKRLTKVCATPTWNLFMSLKLWWIPLFSTMCKLPTAQQQKCCKIKLMLSPPDRGALLYSIYHFWLASAFMNGCCMHFPRGRKGCYEFVTRVPCWPSYSIVFSDTVTVQSCLTLHVLTPGIIW